MKNYRTYIHAAGLAAPGLHSWRAALPVLRGEQAYLADELPSYQPMLLPANERRRASPTVRMAFRVAEEATVAAEQTPALQASAIASVFVSADGDLSIAQRICHALSESQRLISPTDFHNSVHNAAAGYWSIASQAKGPSTAIAAYDYSFATGLLEALCLVHVERLPTLLVAYDIPAPMPLQTKRTVTQPFGAALLLSSQPGAAALGCFTAALTTDTPAPLSNAALESLRQANPAAQALPLLQALACRATLVNLALDTGASLQLSIDAAI